jgi:ATP-binding cassette subfamily B protein
MWMAQMQGGDSALKCLVEVARLRGVDTSVDRLKHDYVLDAGEPNTTRLLAICRDIGLKARSVTMSWRSLMEIGQAVPAIARLANGNCVLVTGVGNVNGTPVVFLRDPLVAESTPMPVDETRFTNAWTGDILLIKRDGVTEEEERPFGFSWFLPVIGEHRGIFRDIGIAAIILSVLSMGLPIFIQIIIDRVLVHQAIGTLNVLLIGMGIVIVFETLFGVLRQYLTLYATNKMDAQVGVRTFAKLVSLPMEFFERSPTGVVTKNIQQTERIRQFLTGQVFNTAIDAIGLIVLIPLMFFYSTPLAVIVLASALILSLLILFMVPIFKRQMQELYASEAQLQSFLVESIQGMRTVKSLALDARQRQSWDSRLARTIENRFKVAKFRMIAEAMIGPVDKITQTAIMGLGAYLVFDGSMMVGALIGFKLVAARVTQPLVSMAGMIQQFQEMALSVRMLGTIMNHPSEQGRSGRGLRAPIEGEVEFQDVRFTYPGAYRPALDNISFTIPKGSVVGVMGRSGSGKTTLTRMLQALHAPQQGMIKIDGHDLREIDLDHLRTNIGVVLQESFLFRGTIRENIGVAKPGATFEQIVAAARLAGADEFIEQLPRGYDTLLEEGSSNLSGGQRQRLAIARALLIDPPIMIFDEATSALDAESEAIVQANLQNIARGRTLIIISHRLASLVACDQIMVMDQGKLADVGRHADLLNRCEVYRSLWYKQNRHLELAS